MMAALALSTSIDRKRSFDKMLTCRAKANHAAVGRRERLALVCLIQVVWHLLEVDRAQRHHPETRATCKGQLRRMIQAYQRNEYRCSPRLRFVCGENPQALLWPLKRCQDAESSAIDVNLQLHSQPLNH